MNIPFEHHDHDDSDGPEACARERKRQTPQPLGDIRVVLEFSAPGECVTRMAFGADGDRLAPNLGREPPDCASDI